MVRPSFLPRWGASVPLDEARNQELPSILVIDDDEISLAVICMMLETEGYRVTQAASGEQALKQTARLRKGSEPSVVLADLQMPGLCGREFALAMRTLLPQATILAMSATPGDTEAYDGFVGKPLDLAALRTLTMPARLDGKAAPAAAAGSDERNKAVRSETVLDEDIYGKLQRMMPPSSLAEIYAVCLRDARQRAEQMPELAHQDDDKLRTVRRSAHAIKGGAGMVGAVMLANSAARIELGDYRKSELPELINKLLNSCDQLQRILMTKVKAC
jgi:CheY-like chemotaxis protein